MFVQRWSSGDDNVVDDDDWKKVGQFYFESSEMKEDAYKNCLNGTAYVTM